MDKIEAKCKTLPEYATFFFKIQNVTRFYRQTSKLKAMENKKIELDILAKLEIATTNLHENINNFEK